MTAAYRYDRARNDGFVLVIVLWVLAILSVVALGIGRQAWLDRQAAAYSLDHAQALMMARGAVNRAAVELRNKTLKDFTMTRSGDVHGAFPVAHIGQPWSWPTNILEEGEYFTEGGEEFENDIVEFRIHDLESKFNINMIPVSFMEELDGLSRPVIRRIEFRRAGDMEQGQPPMLFTTIEELRYFKGIDDDDWFGDGDEPGLPQYLTVWGDAKININTAPREVLDVIPGLDSRTIDDIMEFRAGYDGELYTSDDWGFLTWDELWELVGVEGEDRQALLGFVKLDSNYFEITGIATRRGGKVRAKVTAIVDMNRLLGIQFRDPAIQVPPTPFVRWSEETIGS